ncbi:hypothetical protein [Vibrio natriegens]|uniref:hypothetical protein n=1 Tax=Vibrio natriegens TaxID=691 RepID=UPI00390A00E4
MKKVVQFKKILSGIDIISNVAIGLVALAGVATMAKVHPLSGVGFVLLAALLWVFKVLAFGISYTLIQIAENTMSGVEDGLVEQNVIESDLEKQFSSLYESNQESEKVTDSMHRAYKKIKNGEKVRDIVLETAIEKLQS